MGMNQKYKNKCPVGLPLRNILMRKETAWKQIY